jgi:hypothetical protein
VGARTAAPLYRDRVEWTVDDLAELPPDLNYELINGKLIFPSATPLHQDLCAQVWLALSANCPPGYIASIDQSLKVDRRNEPRPDVVAVHVKHANRSPVLESEEGRYAIGRHTSEVFTSDTPWSVNLDLPALSARRAAIVEQAD